MSGRVNFYRTSVRELSGQVTARSGSCPVGLLSGRITVCRVSVHGATVCRGCVLVEVVVELVSGRATVWILKQLFFF